MRIIAVICLCITTTGWTQEKQHPDIGLGVRLNRMDYFLEADAAFTRRRLVYTAGVGIGIGRTIFQTRFYPEVRFTANYQPIQRKAFAFGPVLSLGISALRINSQSSRVNWWQEYTVGYGLTVGNRLKLVQRAEIGPMAETYHSAYLNRLRTAWTWTYSLQIGLRYAF